MSNIDRSRKKTQQQPNNKENDKKRGNNLIWYGTVWISHKTNIIAIVASICSRHVLAIHWKCKNISHFMIKWRNKNVNFYISMWIVRVCVCSSFNIARAVASCERRGFAIQVYSILHRLQTHLIGNYILNFYIAMIDPIKEFQWKKKKNTYEYMNTWTPPNHTRSVQ